jgi:hypothetical protein
MKVDLYTKAVLTVIAACLVYMCFGKPTLVPALTAQAKPQPQEVVIVGWKKAPGEAEPLLSLLNRELPFRTPEVTYAAIVGWAMPNTTWKSQGIQDLSQRPMPVLAMPPARH